MYCKEAPIFVTNIKDMCRNRGPSIEWIVPDSVLEKMTMLIIKFSVYLLFAMISEKVCTKLKWQLKINIK